MASNEDQSVIDLRLLASRQFGACAIVMLATGAYLDSHDAVRAAGAADKLRFTATWAGLALSPGGLAKRVHDVRRRPAHLHGPAEISHSQVGMSIIALAMWDMTRLNADLNFGFFVWSRLYTSRLGLPLIFIPITAASYDGLRPDQTDQLPL